MLFADRVKAGHALATKLADYDGRNVVVVGLPRGGVVVAQQVARFLKAPLDVVVVRKLSLPAFPEFGIGAIAEGNSKVIDKATITQLGISKAQIAKAIRQEKQELARRLTLYRKGKNPAKIAGKTVILVDDGLATGVSAQAAIKYLKKRKVAKIILAVPVCARETFDLLKDKVDELVCIYTPEDFGAVGSWYQNFQQVGDKEVVEILKGFRIS